MNGLNEKDPAAAIASLFLNMLSREVHTAMPGVVDTVSATAPFTVDVKPLIRSVSTLGKQRAFPIIHNVLLLTFGTQSCSVLIPVAAGDKVLLIFSERSLEKWAGDTNVADTLPGRHFEIADAFALPFNFSAINATDPMYNPLYDNKSVVLKHKHTTGNTMVELLQSGNVAITTPPAGLVTLNGKTVADGGTLLPTDGVVTGMCACSVTGAPHPVVSLTVLAKGLVP